VSPARVLIADDHPTVAVALAQLLADRCVVAGIVHDGRRIADAVAAIRPDIVVVDISMPHVNGLETTRWLKAHRPACKVIVVTMYGDPALAAEAFHDGAHAFVVKNRGNELLAAVDAVLRGEIYVCSVVREEVAALLKGSADPGSVELTAKDRQVLQALVRGRRAREIAGELEMTTSGVEDVKSRLMQRLNVRSTADLVRYALDHGIVT
jgi:DNA-binding NarL/FixJ family response regulator